jgi:hypothetical protein
LYWKPEQPPPSTLMRSIERSPWLTTPELIEIKSVPLDKQKVNEFTLSLQMKRPAETPPVGGKVPASAAKGPATAPQAKRPAT